MSRHRPLKRFTTLAILMFTCVVSLWPGALRAQRGRSEPMVINAARPIAEAAIAIEARYEQTIIYEDPPYVHQSDLVDRTDPKFALQTEAASRKD